MKLSIDEILILQDISKQVLTPVPRGPKPADYEERKAERRAQWHKVGELINRYEQYLNQN